MMRHALAAGLLLAGGGAVAARAHGRPPADPPRTAAVAHRTPPAPAGPRHGSVPGVVVALAPGVITLRANPGQLPAGVAAETTGSPQVNAVLPMAANVAISGRLAVGEHVAVALSGDTVVAVVVAPSPPTPAPPPRRPHPRSKPRQHGHRGS